MITTNRPDGGFGPSYNGELTTTFEDVILIPLPCWIFLVTMAVMFIINRIRARSKVTVTDEHGKPVKPAPSGPDEQGARRHLRLRWTTYIFFLFTFGILFLSFDEIARLANLGWGVGLLPFVPITTIIATALYLLRYRLGAASHSGPGPSGMERGIVWRILAFWAGMIIMEGLKLHTLNELKASFPRKDTGYPVEQQMFDVAILTACMAIVFILTIVEMVRPNFTVK